jgi:hypothetical protein
MIKAIRIRMKEHQANVFIGRAMAYSQSREWDINMQNALNRRAEIACWELRQLIG